MASIDLATLLSTTGDAAFSVGPEGNIRSWNPAAVELFGLPARAAQGQPCYSIVEGLDAHGAPVCSPECPLLPGASESPAPAFDLCIRHGQTGRRWVNVSTLRTHDSVVHLLRDIDGRKRLENVTRGFLAQIAGLAGETVEHLLSPLPPSHEALTPRELEIARLMAAGRSTATIATELGITRVTVRNHVRSILAKLAVHSRTEAVLRAIHEKLI